MKLDQRWLAGALLCASVLLAGCKSGSAGPEEASAEEAAPATVVHGEGSEPSRVTLTEEAMKKIDVQTVLVRDQVVNGATRRVIPYGAVLYDPDGDTWTYTSPEPRVFVRYHISIDSIEEGQAVLAAGPPTGTAVVTVGAAELFGAESEFEEE
jgi:hypothetical protein